MWTHLVLYHFKSAQAQNNFSCFRIFRRKSFCSSLQQYRHQCHVVISVTESGRFFFFVFQDIVLQTSVIIIWIFMQVTNFYLQLSPFEAASFKVYRVFQTKEFEAFLCFYPYPSLGILAGYKKLLAHNTKKLIQCNSKNVVFVLFFH